jgi:hypothetical protein
MAVNCVLEINSTWTENAHPAGVPARPFNQRNADFTVI